MVPFNDLEWPLTQISRLQYYSTSNDSKMVQDISELYLQWPTNIKSHMVYRTAPFSMTLATSNLAFKVTPLFDTEYLTNGYRYGHSYYRKRIGNRTQAFEWHQFQWHWVTSNPDFKVTQTCLKRVICRSSLCASLSRFIYILSRTLLVTEIKSW